MQAPTLSRPRTWQILAWCLPALALSLGACAGSVGTAAAGLVGTEWRLVEMDGETLPERPAATLAFVEADRVAGSGSCNRYFGSVTVSGQRIGFGQMGSTKMACIGPHAELEPRYLSALQQASRFEISDSVLLIHLQDRQQPLRFVRTQP
ncbi:MAG TPA: META domain-containing protein [Hydrogenophaga sp.]|uniref:META domain-containing protein n=1 Tax=Hydrogenophaga sp. TaxID=1904254 RepID=UPI002BCD3934|nr:META domain-containing protein [Hydrogenophaga sp.]HMN93972.1 META domain-containing protein [Hydrogenophaga sp.]HMP09408.1 META domain-containing protein [Hydrogenophaga sp.]